MAEPRRVRRGLLENTDTIEIAGPFDANDPEVVAIAEEILAEGRKDIILDFTKVTYLTSPGLSCVVKVMKKTQAVKGSLTVRNATADMLDLFSLAHLTRLLRFSESA
jgi:anti-anti-sigma factor